MHNSLSPSSPQELWVGGAQARERFREAFHRTAQLPFTSITALALATASSLTEVQNLLAFMAFRMSDEERRMAGLIGGTRVSNLIQEGQPALLQQLGLPTSGSSGGGGGATTLAIAQGMAGDGGGGDQEGSGRSMAVSPDASTHTPPGDDSGGIRDQPSQTSSRQSSWLWPFGFFGYCG